MEFRTAFVMLSFLVSDSKVNFSLPGSCPEAPLSTQTRLYGDYVGPTNFFVIAIYDSEMPKRRFPNVTLLNQRSGFAYEMNCLELVVGVMEALILRLPCQDEYYLYSLPSTNGKSPLLHPRFLVDEHGSRCEEERISPRVTLSMSLWMDPKHEMIVLWTCQKSSIGDTHRELALVLSGMFDFDKPAEHTKKIT